MLLKRDFGEVGFGGGGDWNRPGPWRRNSRRALSRWRAAAEPARPVAAQLPAGPAWRRRNTGPASWAANRRAGRCGPGGQRRNPARRRNIVLAVRARLVGGGATGPVIVGGQPGGGTSGGPLRARRPTAAEPANGGSRRAAEYGPGPWAARCGFVPQSPICLGPSARRFF